MKAWSNSHRSTNILIIFVAVFLVSTVYGQNGSYSFTVSRHDITVLVNEQENFLLQLRGSLDSEVNLTFVKQHPNLIDIIPPAIHLDPNKKFSDLNVGVIGVTPGHLEVTVDTVPNNTWIGEDVFLRVTVANSWSVYYLSIVFGWMYFLAWSVSFYPQIYTNFRRKSVVGLNFDFLSMNIVGFALYSIFNMGLFWIPEIQQEYSVRYPRGLNPVLINDVFFSLHATFATVITILQCFVYERAEQRVSLTARGILSLFLVLIITFGSLAGSNVIHWLDFLYYCSYIKLSITLIKYIPQAVMNYRRKSTAGWSIGNILLDFLGGTLSMLQMILNAYNYDDWDSIFGDPTKFGLGLFSVLFDIFFMLQHYVFYRNQQPYVQIPGEDHPSSEEQVEENSNIVQ